jgi:hypothetical protein
MVMHIIGDGPQADVIRRLGVEHPNFRLIYAGALSGVLRDDYLVQHVDALAAMGTAALDGGILGIPTVLLDVAYATITGDYKFRWLFETTEYVLGDLIGPGSFSPNNTSLDNIIGELCAHYELVSDKTYEYVASHHSLNVVSAGFLRAANHCSFRYGDFPKQLLQKSTTRRMYEWVRKKRSTSN